MTWREATINALTRMSVRHHKNFFTRTQIIKEELHKISQDVATAGRTPPQTLSRVLQELRKEGFLEFDGHGGYTLLTSTSEPVTSDIPHEYTSSDRAPTTVHRIVRDVGIVGELKRLYGYRCQMCGTRLELSSGFYCEAHHLKPLGTPHNGPDAKANIILVCPNHHVLLDYGAIRIDIGSLQVNHHLVSNEFVNYHNQHICRNTEQTAPSGRQ